MELSESQRLIERISEVMRHSKVRSVRAFALSVDIDPSLFAKILKGDREPTGQLLEKIIEKHNVNEEWLLKGQGEAFPATEERGRKKGDYHDRSDGQGEYLEFLKSNDAFFKNQYAVFNAQVLANLTALANQAKTLEALLKINLEHTGNIEAMQAGVPQQQVHDDINRDILAAAGVKIDSAVGTPGKG